MWANVASLGFMAVIGLAFDTLGRKLIFVIGYLMAGICFICLPLANKVYPDFFVMRLFLEIPLRIYLSSPL